MHWLIRSLLLASLPQTHLHCKISETEVAFSVKEATGDFLCCCLSSTTLGCPLFWMAQPMDVQKLCRERGPLQRLELHSWLLLLFSHPLWWDAILRPLTPRSVFSNTPLQTPPPAPTRDLQMLLKRSQSTMAIGERSIKTAPVTGGKLDGSVF